MTTSHWGELQGTNLLKRATRGERRLGSLRELRLLGKRRDTSERKNKDGIQRKRLREVSRKDARCGLYSLDFILLGVRTEGG